VHEQRFKQWRGRRWRWRWRWRRWKWMMMRRRLWWRVLEQQRILLLLPITYELILLYIDM